LAYGTRQSSEKHPTQQRDFPLEHWKKADMILAACSLPLGFDKSNWPVQKRGNPQSPLLTSPALDCEFIENKSCLFLLALGNFM
jgi:hypothetical protein